MRTYTDQQADALAALDRSTHLRVKIEDADGTMQNVSDLEGVDWVTEVVIETNTEQPISRATITLWRRVGLLSLAPLIEASALNVDTAGDYAPLVNPYRYLTVEIATLAHGLAPSESDYVLLWEGYVDEMDWGGFASRVVIHARDPISRLNDTIIETQRTYGSDSAPVAIETVMQSIIDDNLGEGVFTLSVDPYSPNFGVYEYELANVSVLEALKALADLIGWNLHWKWNAAAQDLGLTLWEPQRATTDSLYTFGPDDYYDVTSVGLSLSGIRNRGELVYTDSSGTQQSVTDERASSEAKYGPRFIKLDAQRTSIVNQSDAVALLGAILDDTSDPTVVQQIEAALFWPLELGDLNTYTANGEHYDVDQDWAVFGYSHVLSPTRCRTIIRASGKPSGGASRWTKRERASDRDTTTPEPTELAAVFNPNRSLVYRDDQTKTLTISAYDFLPDDGDGYTLLQGRLHPTTAGASAGNIQVRCALLLPPGTVIRAFRSFGSRATGSDSLSAQLISVTYDNSPIGVTTESLALTSHGADANNWTLKQVTGLNHTVQSGRFYGIIVGMLALATNTDAQFAYVEVDYSVANPTQTL